MRVGLGLWTLGKQRTVRFSATRPRSLMAHLYSRTPRWAAGATS